MMKRFSSTRIRIIGAVVSITALIMLGIGGVLLFGDLPDAEGFRAPTPTSHPSASVVTLLNPHLGDTLYANLVMVRGQLRGPSQRLRVVLMNVDETPLAQATTLAQTGAWHIEMPRPAYVGEVIVRVLSDVDPTMTYTEVTVFFADFATRPVGTFGSLISPTDGEQVGGDLILVRGRASGIPDNRFMLVLQTSDGTLTLKEVVLNNPYDVDDVFWQAELSIEGLSGTALLSAYFTPQSDSNPIFSTVSLIITQSAG